MAATQKNRFLTIKTALGPDVLLIKSFSVTEQLGRLYHIDVELESEKADIDFNALIGSNATVRLTTPAGKSRFFNGCISRFMQTGNEGSFVRYRAELVPWLWLLTRTADCRIFQNKKVPAIIESVFKAHGFNDYKLKLNATYREWEYCVQYRETDFNFVSRLMEQEGIYYHFEHSDGVHYLVLVDSMEAHEAFADYDTLIYRPRSQVKNEHSETVTDWIIEREVRPGSCELSDFNFKWAPKKIMGNANISRSHEHARFEVYDYPGEYTNWDEADAYAKLRIQELQSQCEVLRGQSTVRGLATGHKFTLKGHFRGDQNRAYLVTGASLQASMGGYESGTSADGEFFTCGFTAVPIADPFRPARTTPKPLIQGPQTAIVAGAPGEEIDPDEFGRVKVQFHWIARVKNGPRSSCWIRVSQAWAGKNWGAIYTPRIGQEVIVEFLEGDPDRPIITGRVYNAANKVPYPLPANKNISTLKSESTHGGGGFNEMKFDDTKGKELVYVQAQKDRTVLVKNDNSENVGHDETIVVGNDRKKDVAKNEMTTVGEDRTESVGMNEQISIGENRTEDVGKNESISIGGDRTEDVANNETISIGQNRSEDVGKDEKISIGQNRTETVGKDEKLTVAGNRVEQIGKDEQHKIGKKFSLVAGDEIFLQTGDASITMKKDGTIQIKGKDVTVTGSGKISIKASSDLTLKGSKIAQN